MMPPWAAVAAHALAPTLFRKALQDERQILRRSIYPSTGLRLQCNIWRGARLYRRTQTAHADVEKITKISRESYNGALSSATAALLIRPRRRPGRVRLPITREPDRSPG